MIRISVYTPHMSFLTWTPVFSNRRYAVICLFIQSQVPVHVQIVSTLCRMAGGNDCIVNTLPGIYERLAIFYFQETTQTVCIKSAVILSLGFSSRYLQSMRGYSSYWVVQRSKKSLYHTM